MNTIYLCGGINNLSDSECKDWREATKIALKGLYIFLDPMRRDYRGIEDQNVNSIVEGDYDDIEQSQILLINATKPSWGTAMEVHQAHMQGKYSIAFTGEGKPSPWLVYHTNKIVSSLKEALDYLEDNERLLRNTMFV